VYIVECRNIFTAFHYISLTLIRSLGGGMLHTLGALFGITERYCGCGCSCLAILHVYTMP